MNPRALVVDDDAAVRFTLRQFLEDLEVDVDEAENAEIGLAKHRSRPADVLVVDLRMPGLGGMELLRRSGSHASRVVILTAHGSEREAVEAMKLGAADYLTKPFEDTKGNRSEAARRLGIGRATLHEKLKKHGVGG